jgi:hypothetical protein
VILRKILRLNGDTGGGAQYAQVVRHTGVIGGGGPAAGGKPY